MNLSLAAKAGRIDGSNRMKTHLAAIALTLVGAGSALAADLPTMKSPPMAPPPPVLTWTGVYGGLDVGVAWATDVVTPGKADGGTFPRTNTLSPSGVFGAATLGFNYQMGSLVLGVEGDLGDMDIRGRKADPLGGTEIDKLGSGGYGDVTGRLGVAVDRFLIYGKGGFAEFIGHAHTTTTSNYTLQNSGDFSGWTLGGGVEYKINAAWSVKAEYQYFNFGSQNATLTGGGIVYPYKNALTVNTAKIGLNYAFF